MNAPLSLRLYRMATGWLEPSAPRLLRARARRGKEDPRRLSERLGYTHLPRPDGGLVWMHGASVGETLSLLPLVDALAKARPRLNFLITSGTVTSAELLASRLEERTVHQFAPIDAPGAVARFLDRWRPDLAVFVESELWPNLILQAKARGVRLALLSARASAASLSRWRKFPRAARALLGAFDLVMAQDSATAGALAQLGARDDGCLNLKFSGAPLPCDPVALEAAKAEIGGRPVLLAASTHPGEDAQVMEVFEFLKDRPERPLLILVPRHPARGPEIAELAKARGLRAARRGAGEPPAGGMEVYVADTLGELGLWLRLAKAAFIGGSLLPRIGGHNPLEAARLERPAASGPHVENWSVVYDKLRAADAVRITASASALAGFFAEALVGSQALVEEAKRAKALADREAAAVNEAAELLLELLG